jgi:hypothetical protein
VLLHVLRIAGLKAPFTPLRQLGFDHGSSPKFIRRNIERSMPHDALPAFRNYGGLPGRSRVKLGQNALSGT